MKKILLFLMTIAFLGCSNDEKTQESSYVSSQEQVQGLWKLESQTKGISTTNLATDCAKKNVTINFNSQTVSQTGNTSNTSPCNATTGTADKYSISAGTLIIWQATYKIKYNISIQSKKLVLTKRELERSGGESPIYYEGENQTTETYTR